MARQLDAELPGRAIKTVSLITPSMLKYPEAAIFRRAIKGARILGVSRRAKYALFSLSGGRTLLIHPKMTGHFLLISSPSSRGRIKVGDELSSWKYARFVFELDNGSELAFSDVRKFGTVRLLDKNELESFWEKEGLGPEPLEPSFKVTEFISLISSQNGKIKQVLMDPKIIAGIGNIYSDEMLYITGIHPERRAKSLSEKELAGLYKNMGQVLQNGIALGGSSINNYRLLDGRKGQYQEIRVVYGREGEPCGKCFDKIRRIKVGGRSAHFCPGCQR